MPSRAVTSFLRTIAPNPRGLEPLSVNALSGCYLISTDQIRDGDRGQHFVSMPSRAVTSFLRSCDYNSYSHRTIVSMPSRAVTSFLQTGRPSYQPSLTRVSMPSRAVTSFLPGMSGRDDIYINCVNALSGCYLISTVPLQKPRFYAASRACFCRYLSEYSGNSCFPCMLTIWTHFMRYTYP